MPIIEERHEKFSGGSKSVQEFAGDLGAPWSRIPYADQTGIRDAGNDTYS